MQWSRLGTSIAPAAAMLCKVNISERCRMQPLQAQQNASEGHQALQRLWRTGCCVHAIRTLTRPSWTLCSDGKSARMTHNVPTPRPQITRHMRRRLPPSSVRPSLSNSRESSNMRRGSCHLTDRSWWGAPAQDLVSRCQSVARYERFQTTCPDLVRWRGWHIEDLQSTNGTVLGDRNIRGQHAIRLAPGTKIQFAHRPDAHGARTGERRERPGQC